MRCAICSRQARGYGWFNPRLPRYDPARCSDRWSFCSRRCQNVFCRLMHRTEGRMVDPTELELAAMRACLGPLGECVAAIGMDRPLADYSRDEVLRLIEAAGLKLIQRHDTRPRHAKATDTSDPLHLARVAEKTSLWRLTPA